MSWAEIRHNYMISENIGGFLPSFELVFARYLKGKKVLDVGCATGVYLEHLGNDSVGIDLSERNLSRCRAKRLKTVLADASQALPVRQHSFDAVLLSHVLEHVDSPLSLLQKSNEVLKNSGLVIIGFPIEHSLMRMILRDPYFNGHPGHLYSFSREGIERLLDVSGFRLIEVIFDVPLVRRLKAKWLLHWGRYFPRILMEKVCANIWYIGGKVGGQE